jgi:LEA14-like dessication related protein
MNLSNEPIIKFHARHEAYVITIAKAVFVIYSLIVCSCSYLNQRLYVKNCTFSLTQVDIQKFGLTGVTLGLYLTITNPNTIEVRIDKMDVDLYIENKKTIRVAFNPAAIEPKKSKKVRAALVIPYSAVGMTIIDDLKNKGKISYRLAGNITMNTPLGAVSFPVTISEN